VTNHPGTVGRVSPRSGPQGIDLASPPPRLTPLGDGDHGRLLSTAAASSAAGTSTGFAPSADAGRRREDARGGGRTARAGRRQRRGGHGPRFGERPAV